ncbi:TetR/AcrR family transcriptional regulator [Noviherbaspirillum sp.]|uniref:TetR/AcrR family transcriptional regulator n=1 Tax=Noviherbaspirillum sp. TaxID=1926288 RepID=UPI002D282521|nr:TetR/AcrR family transcriptional regulator [Noviherbaspirillum sp.]HZW22968.1 TetR/AcrR family transcriptional regulator [Noviherbaspirillum sp.]
MVYRRTEYVEQKIDNAKTAIVTATIRLITTGGWRAASIAAVARTARVAAGSVYLHFPSKSQLLCEAYRRIAELEVKIIADIAHGEGTPGERLSAAIETFARRALRGRRKAYAVIAEPADEAEIERLRLHYRKQFVSQFVHIIDDGIRAGEFTQQDSNVTGACVLGALAEAIVVPLADESYDPVSRTPQLICEIQAYVNRAIGVKRTSSRPAIQENEFQES